MGKTGGGKGTNQHAVRGVSQALRQDAIVLDDLQTKTGRSDNPNVCRAILVGGEWHAVQDEITGKPMDEIAATEQCDNCGSNLFTREPDPNQPLSLVYRCESCGSIYRAGLLPSSLCVWY